MTALPQQFGRYTLHRKIGEGGMAEVYSATVAVAEGLAKRLVVKKIRRDCADQPEYARMFVDEAKIALGLNHANIVQVFDFGQVQDDLYLAMELVEGVDLMRLIHTVHSRDERVPPVIAAYIAHQVAAGLAYAHQKRDDFDAPIGIVHRDISPHNIMLSFAGTVKVLDFGIARPAPDSSALPRHRLPYGAGVLEDMTIQGKVAYMAPEQAMGKRVDPRADIYALGVVLYEMLTGTLVFRGKSPTQLLEEVRTRPLKPLAEAEPGLSAPLIAVVDRALARTPDRRWESARAMQSALAAFLHRADPVVDDEVLSDYVARYHRRPSVDRAEFKVEDKDATREFSEADGEHALPARRESLDVVVLHAHLAPTEDAEVDRDRFLLLARDIAYKGGAHVIQIDAAALVFAFGVLAITRSPAEQAVQIAQALREAIGDAAPGLGIGVALAELRVKLHRIAGAPLAVEIDPVSECRMRQVAKAALDGPVMLVGDPPEGLARRWRLGEPELIDPDDDGELAPAELDHACPLLGPAQASERRIHHAPGARAVLYGRELELRTLRECFAEAIRARAVRAVLITSAPGLGKRTLVERFVTSIPRRSAEVLRFSGQWRRRNVSLGALLRLLQGTLGIHTKTTYEELTQRLTKLRISDPEALAGALGDALDLAGAPPHKTPPSARREAISRLFRRLVRVLAERRPVLVVLENLHFADAHSLALLGEWLGRQPAHPLLVVMTTRPSPRIGPLRALPGLIELDLSELDARARRELIIRRFADPGAAAELADAILARTSGNPLFIEETLAHLLRQGVIAWDARGRFLEVRQRGATIQVPRSVEAALHAHLDALRPGEREVVEAAAILGQSFRPEEVARLVEREVARDVDRLRSLGVFESDPNNNPLRFTSISLHELCKETTARELSRRLHARAVAIKHSRSDYSPGRDDGPIAEHLLEAGRTLEAVEPALRAASAARDLGGSREAHYFLSLALKALPSTDRRRFAILGDRESILRAWGRRRLQGADLRQMIDLASSDDDAEREVEASLRLLRFYLDCGRIQHAEQLIPRLIARITALDDPSPARATLGELHSDLLLAQGAPRLAEDIAREALQACPNEKGRHQRAKLLLRIGRAELDDCRLVGARTTLNEVLTIARALNDRRIQADALTHLGEVARRSTRYQRAIDCFLEALEIDRELGDRVGTGTKLANLGITYSAIGLHRRAERYLRKALELHEALGHTGLLGEVVVHLGEVVAELGEADAASSLLTDAAAIANARGDLRTELRARARQARIVLNSAREGSIDKASALATKVLQQAREHSLPSAMAHALHILSCAAELRGDPQQAIRSEREAVELVEAGAAPVDGLLSVFHLGQVLTGSGDPEGERWLNRAAELTQARLDDLQSPELRRSYLAQRQVQKLLQRDWRDMRERSNSAP